MISQELERKIEMGMSFKNMVEEIQTKKNNIQILESDIEFLEYAIEEEKKKAIDYINTNMGFSGVYAGPPEKFNEWTNTEIKRQKDNLIQKVLNGEINEDWYKR